MFGFDVTDPNLLVALPVVVGLVALLALAAALWSWRAAAEFWRVPLRRLPRFRVAAIEAGTAAAIAALLSAALAMPYWGYQPGPVVHRGRDLVLVVDVSRSMLAEDVMPSRLERAKADLADFVAEAARRGGARIGLVAFAGVGRSLAPLTESYDYLRQRLEQLEPGSVYRGGSYLETGLREALSLFDERTQNYRDILLVTDGDDFGSDWQKLTRDLTRAGVSVHVIVRGDPDYPSEIPIYDHRGGRRLLRYRGRIVQTKAHPEKLRELAQRTGGRFVPAFTGQIDSAQLYEQLVLRRKQRQWAEKLRARPIYRFQWFLAPALALLLWQTWRWYCRTTQITNLLRVPASLAVLVAAVAALGLVGAGPGEEGRQQDRLASRQQARQLVQHALELARRGAGREAVAAAEQAAQAAPDWWLPHYELATLLAVTGDWPSVARSFLDARTVAPLAVHPLLNYGIGTAFLEQAEQLIALGERDRAISALTRAEQFLDDALRMLPELGPELDRWLSRLVHRGPRTRAGLDEQIRTNLELARRLLAQLRQAAQADNRQGQERPQQQRGDGPSNDRNALRQDERSENRTDQNRRNDQPEKPQQQLPPRQADPQQRQRSDSQQQQRQRPPQDKLSVEELDRVEALERLRAEMQRLRERERLRFRERAQGYIPRAERDW